MSAEKILMVLRQPHTSEKSTVMADKFKQFTFKVLSTATKTDVKKAVEQLFNVKVKNVNIINVKGKVKRFRQLTGKRNDWKKALVTLQADQDIDFSVTE